jgi:hypothetical protein
VREVEIVSVHQSSSATIHIKPMAVVEQATLGVTLVANCSKDSLIAPKYQAGVVVFLLLLLNGLHELVQLGDLLVCIECQRDEQLM